MMNTPHPNCASLALAVTLLVSPGCKPEAPNLHDQKRPAASARAEAAKAAIGAGKDAAKKVAGLTAEQGAAVVARIGDHTIALADVAAYVAQLPRSARSRYVTPEQRLELVQHMVEVELLAREGESRGFGTDPVVQHTFKKAMANELLRSVAGEKTLGDITDEDVAAYYTANKRKFVRKERRRAAVIYFNSRADAVAANTALRAAIDATPKAAKQIFGDWAKEKSVDQESARLKGDLGWFDAKGLNAKGQNLLSGLLLDVIYGMKTVHQVSAPLELESTQWVLVQLTGLKPAAEAPLADVRLEIKDALLKKHLTAAREHLIASLRAKATIEIDEKVLATLPKAPADDAVKVPRDPTKKKPRINPALFQRRVSPGIVKKPGTDQPTLSLDKGRAALPKEVLEVYQGPQGNEAGAP